VGWGKEEGEGGGGGKEEGEESLSQPGQHLPAQHGPPSAAVRASRCGS
jgi:hypothetical protein